MKAWGFQNPKKSCSILSKGIKQPVLHFRSTTQVGLKQWIKKGKTRRSTWSLLITTASQSHSKARNKSHLPSLGSLVNSLTQVIQEEGQVCEENGRVEFGDACGIASWEHPVDS